MYLQLHCLFPFTCQLLQKMKILPNYLNVDVEKDPFKPEQTSQSGHLSTLLSVALKKDPAEE